MDNLEEILRNAKEAKNVVFPPLLPQLIDFIEEESKKPPFKNKDNTFFFEEGGRKGYVTCRYVLKGTRVFRCKSGEPEPMLNITHVVIEEGKGEKNIVQRISKEIVEGTSIGVRIESILSDKWLSTFEHPWEIINENNAVLLKKGGRKTRKLLSFKKKIRITQR